jgi:hypothetical protein
MVIAGPGSEWSAFLESLTPVLESFRIDFIATDEQSDELHAHSNRFFPYEESEEEMVEEDDEAEDAPGASKNKPAPSPRNRDRNARSR